MLSRILDKDVLVIYPCTVNHFTRVDLFSGLIRCSTSEEPGKLVLSWTHVTETNVEAGNWTPNHFVPCYPKAAGMF